MLIEHVIVSLVVLLLLALLAEKASRAVNLPYCSMLVLMGFVLSEIIVFFGIDTGIRADNFHDLIFFVFIPVLVFDAAFRINKQLLLKNIFPILVFAIIGMLVTAGITAVGLYYGIGHASGFPWIAALLTAAILAATNPAAVLAQLREAGASRRVEITLEGESLFNDAVAIVLFSLFLSLSLAVDTPVSLLDASMTFVKVFAGGCLVGLVIGYIAGVINNSQQNSVVSGVLTIVVAYGSCLMAEQLFQVSGVMSTLVAAMIMSIMMGRKDIKVDATKSVYLWDLLGHVASSIVFIIMGVTITVGMFEERWLAMLIAIVAVMVARLISVYGLLSLTAVAQKQPVDLRSQSIIVWGGLRGAVTLALALSLPVSLEYWWTIQSIAFGVVVFSLFVQAPTMRFMVARLKVGDDY